MSTRIEIPAHYPDALPVEIVIGATGKNARYTVGDLRAALRVPAPQGDAAPPLDRRLKRIADEMPALRDFIRAEHGPIGWEHTLNIWITDLQKITALRGGASSSGSAPSGEIVK